MVQWEVNQKPMQAFQTYLNQLEKEGNQIEIKFCDITNSWVRYVIKITKLLDIESESPKPAIETKKETANDETKKAKVTTRRRRKVKVKEENDE